MSSSDEDTQSYTGYIERELSDVKQLENPTPIVASHCRKGVFVMLKECPCKISELKISKTGKHGSTKANMTGYDILTGRRYQETVPGHTSMYQYTPVKIDYEVSSVTNRNAMAIHCETGEQDEFELPQTDSMDSFLSAFHDNAKQKGDLFWVITVVYVPRGNDKKWMANFQVESVKAGKPD